MEKRPLYHKAAHPSQYATPSTNKQILQKTYLSRGTFSPRASQDDEDDLADKLPIAEDIKNLIRMPLSQSLKRSSPKK